MKLRKSVYLIFSLMVLAAITGVILSKQDCAPATVLAGSSGVNIPVNDEEDCCPDKDVNIQSVKVFIAPVKISVPEKRVITMNLLPKTIMAGQRANYRSVKTLLIPDNFLLRDGEIQAFTGVFLL